MTPELLVLLSEVLGDVQNIGTISWSQVVMHRNLAALPPPPLPKGDFAWNMGFDVLLLDGSGQATHYCKFRPPAEISGRMRDLVDTLYGDDTLDAFRVRVHTLRTPSVTLYVSGYSREPVLDSVLSRLSVEEWASAVRSALAASRAVVRRGKELAPWLDGAGSTVCLVDAAAGDLDSLVPVVLTPQEREWLQSALDAAGPMPRSMQHGDLWAGNVTRREGRWVLLDLDTVGEVDVQLYDVFHMLLGALDLRRGRTAPAATWLHLMKGFDPRADACRAILREEVVRERMTPAQVVGAFTYYLVKMTAWIRGRGGRPVNWRPLALELRELAVALRDPEAVLALIAAQPETAPGIWGGMGRKYRFSPLP